MIIILCGICNQDPCIIQQGVSSYGFFASADSSDGSSGFTVPANNTSRYVSWMSWNFSTAPTISAWTGTWFDRFAAGEFDTLTNGSSVETAVVSDATTVLLTVTIAKTGTYIAQASSYFLSTGSAAGNFEVSLLGTGTIAGYLPNAKRLALIGTSGNTLEVGVNAAKFNATAGDTVTLVAKLGLLANLSMNFEVGNLIVQQVKP